MRGKKGDIFEGLIFVVLVFILAVGFIIFSYVNTTITGALRNTEVANTTAGQRSLDTLENFGMSGLQKGFLFIVVFLIISQMITAYRIKSHPIYLVAYVLISIINIIFSVYLANSFELLNTGALANTYSQNTMISGVMSNLVRISLVSTAISMIILFARYNSEGGAGGRF